QIGRYISDRNAAKRCSGGEDGMVGLDFHDVVILGHRPVRTEHAVLAVVHRVFFPKTLEVGCKGKILKQFGVTGIHVLERHGVSTLTRLVDRLDRTVHWASLRSRSSGVVAPG